jgi:integral membrane protein (TIGR01906 family)
MRKALCVLLAVSASVALFVAIFITCIEWTAFNESKYTAVQERERLDTVTGISLQDLKTVTRELLRYCRGERSDLDMQVPVNGQMREVFDEREKAHMVDVQALFVKVLRLRAYLLAAFAALALLLIPAARRRTLRELARGWVIAASGMGVLLVALGVYFALDFDRAWTQFHLLFFSNDLWQLYENEVLIQMLMPPPPLESMFDILVREIVLSAAAALAAVTALAVVALRFTRPKKPEVVPDAR